MILMLNVYLCNHKSIDIFLLKKRVHEICLEIKKDDIYIKTIDDTSSLWELCTHVSYAVIFFPLYDIDNFSLIEQITKYNHNIIIIAVSNTVEYCYAAFIHGLWGYILPPYKKNIIKTILTRAYLQYILLKSTENKFRYILLCKERETVKIFQDHIYYIIKDGNKCIFHLKEDTFYKYISMKNLFSYLGKQFILINKGIIININKIKSYNKNEITLYSVNEKFYVSQAKIKTIRNLLGDIYV